MWFIVNAGLLKFFPSLSEADNSLLTAFPVLLKQPAYVIAVLKVEYSERMRGPKSGPESGRTERQKRRK